MKNILYLIILILCTSCVSKLKVTVEVADRDKIIAEDIKLNKLNIPYSINSLEKFINNWATNYDGKLNELFSNVQTTLGTTALSDAVIESFTTKINSHITNLKANKDEADKNYKSYLKDADEQSYVISKYYVDKAANDLLSLEAVFQEANILSAAAVERVPTSQNLAVAITDSKTALSNNGSTRTRFPILGDELAWFIAKNKDKDIWKSLFNKTVCSNFMGNADMAMILRSNPPEREIRSGDYNNNFTIKGVRLDAADATNALVTGLTQTFNFIASTQGFPSILNATPQTGTAENPLPSTISSVNSIYDDKYKIESDKKKYEKCKALLIEKIKKENILAMRDRDEAKIKEAAKRIREYWETIIKIELEKP